MSDNAVDLARLKRETLAARAQMESTLGAVKQRLAPSTLAEQAREKVRETTSAVRQKAGDTVRARPATTAAAAGLAGLVLFRKPIGRLVKALFGREARQRRRTARAEAEVAAGAERTGSGLPPSKLIPDPPARPDRLS